MRESFTRTGAIARRIITQFRRDPRTIALLFIAPIIILTLVGYVIAEKTTPVSVGLVDFDQGATLSAGPLTLDIEAGSLLETALTDRSLELRSYASAEDMLADVRDGKLYGGVVIPPDFTSGILAGRGFGDLRLIVEGSDAMLAGDISRRYAQALQSLPEKLAQEHERVVPPGVNVPAPPTTPRAPAVEFTYGGPELGTLSYFAPSLVAFIAFFLTFLLTSVSFLRERSSGTMERLLASPVQRGEIVVGYLLGFGIFALAQSLVILLFSVYALGVKLAGSLGAAFTVEAALVAVAVVMGIFFSFYARNELQVIQFIPIVVLPQAMLSGLLTPIDTMWEPLRWLAYAMPMTYANDGLRAVMVRGWSLGSVGKELAVLGGFLVLFTLLASRLIKRQVA